MGGKRAVEGGAVERQRVGRSSTVQANGRERKGKNGRDVGAE